MSFQIPDSSPSGPAWPDPAERVSALVDGELGPHETAMALAYLDANPQAQADWDAYHIVGEAMRSSTAPRSGHDPRFLTAWRARLTSENAMNVASHPLSTREKAEFLVQSPAPRPAANDAWWRRVAGLAVVVAVGVFSWQAALLFHAQELKAGAWQLAQAPAPPSTAATAAVSPGPLIREGTEPEAPAQGGVMIRDPELDLLLAAHRQVGGATALQAPSGFLRNATFSEGLR